MKLDELNRCELHAARAAFECCCGARAWVEAMCAGRPFVDRESLFDAAEQTWRTLDSSAWREAFAHHPRIGDVSVLRERFASTAGWASDEQHGAATATEAVLEKLAAANRDYEQRFGYIFIVCATGKSAAEMLAILESRLGNDADAEIAIAAEEQMKITKLRLQKLLDETP